MNIYYIYLVTVCRICVPNFFIDCNLAILQLVNICKRTSIYSLPLVMNILYSKYSRQMCKYVRRLFQIPALIFAKKNFNVSQGFFLQLFTFISIKRFECPLWSKVLHSQAYLFRMFIK